MFRNCSLIAFGLVLLCSSPQWALCQEKGKDKPAGDAAKGAPAQPSQEEVDQAMAAVTPGKVHEQLAKLEGKWKVTTTIVMEGMEPQPAEGNAELKMTLGGRFIQETGDGDMMGFPVEHFRLWGYNNGTKKYQAVWVYTMSTGFLQMEGTSSDDGKTIQWKGHFDNEVGIREELSAVTKFVDDDHFNIELSAGKMPDGSDGPVMKASYARAK